MNCQLLATEEKCKNVRGNEDDMLYLMRHGKTEWNELHKLQGRTDIPLNEEGRRMAAEAAEKYREVHFDICYCSPLIRARETAELVLQGREIPIVCDDRLVEMGFGSFEGLQNCFQIPDSPVRVLFKDPAHYKAVDGAESLDELYERTGSFLREVVEPELAQGRDVLIVGHGAMNSCILCQVRHIEREHFWDAGIENCKLMQLL